MLYLGKDFEMYFFQNYKFLRNICIFCRCLCESVCILLENINLVYVLCFLLCRKNDFQFLFCRIDQWINFVVILVLSVEFLLKFDFFSVVFYCCWCRWYVFLFRKVSFEVEVIFGIYFYFLEIEEGICFEKWVVYEVFAQLLWNK